MNQSVLDANFKFNNIVDCGEQLDWYNFDNQVFSLHGVFYDYENGEFLRLPKSVAKATSVGVEWLANQTSGGRIKFSTDSKIVALKVVEGLCDFKSHIPITGQMGFSLYTDGKYDNTFAPKLSDVESRKDQLFSFATYFRTIHQKPQGEFYDYQLNFPLYSSVKALQIGVIKGSKFTTTKPYDSHLPIVYYGSSITQGACASHPGNEYQGYISRQLNLDYINLGFAGKAKGEQVLAEYISSIPHSIFVFDYDNNAPTLEHLEQTHYAFYKTYRKTCKDTPIIFVTKPNWWRDFPQEVWQNKTLPTTKIIKSTYKKALKEGDKNVYFVDGKTFFGKEIYNCTVDSCHPNDLGFYLMAKKLTPVIKRILETL